MKDTSYRTFEVQRTNATPLKFAVQTRKDGGIQVTGIRPYDDAEYHWALKLAGQSSWRIIRNGRTVSTVGITGKPAQSLTPEQIAYFLIDADTKSRIKPICAI